MNKLVVLTPEELRTLIQESVKAGLQALSQPEASSAEALPEWLTRKDVAAYLSISLATVDNFTRDGLLKKHYVAGLPRFKREEVIQALKDYSTD